MFRPRRIHLTAKRRNAPSLTLYVMEVAQLRRLAAFGAVIGGAYVGVIQLNKYTKNPTFATTNANLLGEVMVGTTMGAVIFPTMMCTPGLSAAVVGMYVLHWLGASSTIIKNVHTMRHSDEEEDDDE